MTLERETVLPMVPHGISTVLTAPACFRFTAPCNPGKNARLPQLLGVSMQSRSAAGREAEWTEVTENRFFPRSSVIGPRCKNLKPSGLSIPGCPGLPARSAWLCSPVAKRDGRGLVSVTTSCGRV